MFYAQLLHYFPQIPHLHIHLELFPPTVQRCPSPPLDCSFHPPPAEEGEGDGRPVWKGSPGNDRHFTLGGRLLVPGSQASEAVLAEEGEAELKRLLEVVAVGLAACPVSTCLRFSLGPYIPSLLVPPKAKARRQGAEEDKGSDRGGGRAEEAEPFRVEDEFMEVLDVRGGSVRNNSRQDGNHTNKEGN